MVGDLGYSWRKLKRAAAEVADTLATVQVGPGSCTAQVACVGVMQLVIKCYSEPSVQCSRFPPSPPPPLPHRSASSAHCCRTSARLCRMR